jgi:hypothetical protein
MHPDGLKMVSQVLVKWSDLDESLATWENVDRLRQMFPQASALEQAGCYHEGNFSNQGKPKSLEATGPRRSTQAAQPNSKYVGTEWA